MRRAQNTGADAPAVVRAAIPLGFVLEEARGQIAGLRRGQEFQGGGAQVAAAGERAAVEQHLAEARVVRRGGIESAIALGRAVARTEVGSRRDGFERTGIFVFRIGGGQAGALLELTP